MARSIQRTAPSPSPRASAMNANDVGDRYVFRERSAGSASMSSARRASPLTAQTHARTVSAHQYRTETIRCRTTEAGATRRPRRSAGRRGGGGGAEPARTPAGRGRGSARRRSPRRTGVRPLARRRPGRALHGGSRVPVGLASHAPSHLEIRGRSCSPGRSAPGRLTGAWGRRGPRTTRPRGSHAAAGRRGCET